MMPAEDEIKTISLERQRAILYTAMLETIRINRWNDYSDFKDKIGSVNETSQDLDSDPLEHGWIYVITNIVGVETGTKATTVALGYVRTEKFYIMTKQTPANNNDSVDYVGQIIMREGDRIRAEFKGATAADTVELFVNGFRVRL